MSLSGKAETLQYEENINVFSLHFIGEIDWEGDSVKYLGTFRSSDDAVKGFTTWVSSLLGEGNSNRELLMSSLLSELKSLNDVNDVNRVLEHLVGAFNYHRVSIEVTEHKLGEVLLKPPSWE